jgi:hypothetical protein
MNTYEQNAESEDQVEEHRLKINEIIYNRIT